MILSMNVFKRKNKRFLPLPLMLDFLNIYPDTGLLALRITLGVIFLVHGTKKLDGKMGGFMTFIGVAETAGGLAIFLGFLTAWAALGIAIIMLGAMYKKINEWHIPFTTMSNTGWEFDLLILASCITLMVFGAGTWSVDAMWML